MLQRFLIIGGASLLLTACAGFNHRLAAGEDATQVASHPVAIASEDCSTLLDHQLASQNQRLNAGAIRLLNWNAHKHMDVGMQNDLMALTANTDLILLQEAVPEYGDLLQIEPSLNRIYAPGYNWGGLTTGVITASKVAPLAHCRIMSREPWLGSPKAINMTRYGLTGTSDTLLVVNVHLINFTFGTSAIQEQLDAISVWVNLHEGPVIISGDFNTWSKSRAAAVSEAMQELGLTSVNYASDQRTRIFGNAVDHLFVREISAESATTVTVSSSDHNPITVELSL
jgi:endonuclease/exonuclease/phosphatase (EEP) superfamily protein YafD